jgi:hypothetical protein
VYKKEFEKPKSELQDLDSFFLLPPFRKVSPNLRQQPTKKMVNRTELLNSLQKDEMASLAIGRAGVCRSIFGSGSTQSTYAIDRRSAIPKIMMNKD